MPAETAKPSINDPCSAEIPVLCPTTGTTCQECPSSQYDQCASHKHEFTFPTTSVAEQLERFNAKAQHASIKSAKREIHFTVAGTGPTVHIVPGIVAPRTMYFPLAHELVEQGNRVIVHDLAGIGQHDGVAIKKYSLDDYVADFFELINATGGGPVGVIGQSFGTTITIRALAQSPEQFRAAALLGGFAKRQLTAVERSLARLLYYWPGQVKNAPLYRTIAEHNFKRELDYRAADRFEYLVACKDTHLPVSIAVRQALAVDQTDIRALLPKVETPVLVVHGAEDRQVPVAAASELQDGLRNCRIMIIPKCGHLPHLSHPELLSKAWQNLLAR